MIYYTVLDNTFSTKRKLDHWRRDHPEATDDQIKTHEIPLDIVKELHKLSKKPAKCVTCGK